MESQETSILSESGIIQQLSIFIKSKIIKFIRKNNKSCQISDYYAQKHEMDQRKKCVPLIFPFYRFAEIGDSRMKNIFSKAFQTYFSRTPDSVLREKPVGG